MKKTSLIPFLLTLLSLALLLSACGFPSADVEDQVALSIAQTQLAQSQTALAGADKGPTRETDSPLPVPTATQTPEPSKTPTPTLTLTLTEESPTISVSVDTNCRSGPGKQYDIIGALLVGETAQVIGRTAGGQYWIVQNPDRAGECWLWDTYATVTGPTDSLPIYTPPPTPTPQFTWEGTWDTVHGPPAGMVAIIPMTVTVEGRNLSATIPIPGDPVLVSGTISDDWLSVSGTWSDGTHSGTFKFFALGSDQFNGSSQNGETWEWCGGRGGAALPDPCLRE